VPPVPGPARGKGVRPPASVGPGRGRGQRPDRSRQRSSRPVRDSPDRLVVASHTLGNGGRHRRSSRAVAVRWL